MANILVVEDELGMREWLAEILELAGHRVFTAGDGLEARSVLNREMLELVITDISMPNEEGLGLIRGLRKARPELKIVALSGADSETLQDAKLLGAYVTLRKPVSAQIVLQCIRELLITGPAM